MKKHAEERQGPKDLSEEDVGGPVVENYQDFLLIVKKNIKADVSRMSPSEVGRTAIKNGLPQPIVERITKKFIKFYYKDQKLSRAEMDEMRKDIWLLRELY
jgi:hypothetical protein